MIRFQKHNPKPARRGVAAAEFAVCVPVLVLLMLGMLECCTMIFLKQSLAVAAYEGAHIGVGPDATTAQVRQVCEGILTDRNVRGGSVQVLPGNLDSIAEGEYFEIRVSAPTDQNGVLPARFFRGQTLRSSAVMMKGI